MRSISASQDAPIKVVFPPSLNYLAPTVVDNLIRVGAVHDGGYVVPANLVRESAVLISLGIGEDWSFDRHFVTLNPRVRVDSYDHTMSARSFRKELLLEVLRALSGRSSVAEVKRRIGVLNAYDTFFRGNVRHFQQRIYNRVDFPHDVTLSTVFRRAGEGQVFLKIDIEGTEYRIIDDMVRYAERICGIVIEFHDTGPLRTIFNDSVAKLRQHFEIVHMHGNNNVGVAADGVPEVMELTFERKPLPSPGGRRHTLPLPEVDAPNNPDRPDFEMSFRPIDSPTGHFADD